MTLVEMVGKITPSDRLIVVNSGGEELYRGFAANFVHGRIQGDYTVKSFGLSTDIFRKEQRKERTYSQLELKEKIPVESINNFGFSDLAMLIYTKIVIED